MSFADRYQTASFRGVPFRVRSNSRSSGLLTDTHVYPGKTRPANVFVEILGQDVVTFSLTGYVMGEDHDTLRDRLEAALAEPSVGQLVLPLRPALDVVCQSHSVNEDEERLGISIFQMTFTEALNQPSAAPSVSTGRALAAASGDLRTAAAEDFASVWDVDGPRWVYESGAETLDLIGGGYISQVCQGVGVADMKNNALDLFLRNVDSASDLAQSFLTIATRVGEGVLTADDVAGLLRVGAPEYAAAFPFSTSTASRIAANSRAVSDLLDRVFVAEAAARSVRVSLDSDVQANALLSALNGSIERIAGNAGGDVFRSAKAIGVAAGRDLSIRGRAAGRLVNISLSRTDAFENVSHALYDTGENVRELITRNRGTIPHPGFIAPGVTLEAVLKPDTMGV